LTQIIAHIWTQYLGESAEKEVKELGSGIFANYLPFSRWLELLNLLTAKALTIAIQ